MIASAGKRSLVDRMLGAALLEAEIYEEAALMPSTRTQAALVVMLSAIAAGLGSLGAGMTGFVMGSLAVIFGWSLYAFFTYWTATTRLGVPHSLANWGAMLRALGLASSPRVFLIFTIVPGIGLLVALAVHAWVLITTVFAVRLTLDLKTRPAVVAAVAGWLPMLLVWVVVAVLV